MSNMEYKTSSSDVQVYLEKLSTLIPFISSTKIGTSAPNMASPDRIDCGVKTATISAVPITPDPLVSDILINLSALH
jgi:hypothetical protein